jgi:hypothetical protein
MEKRKKERERGEGSVKTGYFVVDGEMPKGEPK